MATPWIRAVELGRDLILLYLQAVEQEAIECPDDGHHGYCWWCWRWRSLVHEYTLQWRTHGYCGWPLCEACSLRYLFGWGPPWYPNHEQRCQLLVRRIFERQAEDTVYASWRRLRSRRGLPRGAMASVAAFASEYRASRRGDPLYEEAKMHMARQQ